MVAKGYPLEVEKETAPTGKRDGLLDSHPNTAVMLYHGNDDAGHREIGRDGRFIAYANETVLDTKINLMWAAKDNGSDINWEDAKVYCQTYRGGGYTDWRMPTQDELAGLYDHHSSNVEKSENEKSKNKKSKEVKISYHLLTKEITLTSCCPWASETRGSEAAYFNFFNNERLWNDFQHDFIRRALPVRSAK